ncbi:Leucine Rich repeats (2 copies) [Gimesia panareensis]|uniref:Leucine Rich repeats (2 copies) n=1 Tax=Gimesia panareensis TaxID=2527978 RepID=A0A517QDA5_9PLAN|nr:hypothetical protein [Gimesia panareensis]QDT29613.1 Leucine Rich repeats (2 copies) [Gimesia panareensis]
MLNQHTTKASRSNSNSHTTWSRFNFRFLLTLLLLAILICLTPFLVSRWRSKVLVDSIRSHGGRVLFSHGYCPNGYCLAWYPELEPFTETISYILIPSEGKFQVTDEFIESFGQQPFLMELTLGDEETPTTLTDQSLDSIIHFPLKILHISGGSITDAGLNQLKDCSSLFLIVLKDQKITGELFDCAPSEFPQLTGLTLSGSPVTDKGLMKLSALHRLEHIDLSRTRVTGQGLRHLSLFKKLTALTINQMNFSPEEMKSVSELELLDSLYMSGNNYHDQHVAQVARLELLTDLQLDDTRVTDAGLIPLTNLKHLEHLFLNNTEITDAGIKHLIDCPSLRELELSNTKITAKVLESLRQMPQLKVVYAYDTQLSTGDYYTLKEDGFVVHIKREPRGIECSF